MPRPSRRVRILGAVFAALCVLFFAEIAFGHDTWLLGSASRVAVGATVTLSLTSGDAFPNDDFVIDPSRVSRAVARQGTHIVPLKHPVPGTLSLRYRWRPKYAGVATIGVELRPKTLTLAPEKIEEYLTEIDATPAVRATWDSVRATRGWVESYSKHTTTYLRVGDAEDSSWRQPLGFGLEIVPERDPTTLRTGDTLVVRVLRAGGPVRDFAVGAIREGRDKARFTRTDGSGRARITFDDDGRWLLNGTHLRRSMRRNVVWESDFVTMTLHVAPR
ncbi:MAG TPA: DUF4198 domain-containing protein [Gemmatimonadaceae bacterium]|nr:DUF4198 domain-containing protein [Gemmatimonadaceae bacterium]